MPDRPSVTGSIRQKLEAAGLLDDLDDAVHTLDVTRVLALLREVKLPEREVKRMAASLLVNASLAEE